MVWRTEGSGLSAAPIAASSILSAWPGGQPALHGAKPDSLTTHHFANKKNHYASKEESIRFPPDFQAYGTRSGGRFACGNRDSGRDGKHR